MSYKFTKHQYRRVTDILKSLNSNCYSICYQGILDYDKAGIKEGCLNDEFHFLENDDSIRMNANSVHPEINSIAEYFFLRSVSKYGPGVESRVTFTQEFVEVDISIEQEDKLSIKGSLMDVLN